MYTATTAIMEAHVMAYTAVWSTFWHSAMPLTHSTNTALVTVVFPRVQYQTPI